MRSIIYKFTLAFLFVGLTGSILVAIIVWARTQSAFNQFLFNREQQSLVNSLTDYYAANGSWDGIPFNIQPMFFPRNREGMINRDWTRFILIDADHNVIFSMLPEQTGQPISMRDLDTAIPLQVEDTTVGWLILASPSWERIPNSPEDLFLRTFNRATLLSALVALVLAIVLGSVLAFTMTHSLRDLTEATMKIAQGELGLQVKVRSKDELGKLAESFNQMSLELEQATLARRQMTADIAHDLRSPLSVIAGYTEALSDGKLPGTPEVYAVLHQETKHLNRLIEDLRTLSLADAGELSLTRQVIDPQILIKRAVSRFAVTAQQKDISLQFKLAGDLARMSVDVDRMAQVFDNLLLNAFRYTPQGGEIRLSACAEGDWVALKVQDNGDGIDPQDLPYIFDRFYRGDKARQQDGESGLGLAIVRSIVEIHGGKITVESSLGQGAVFTIHLPASPS
jgi:two-component system sensor histidine kinase BaeS